MVTICNRLVVLIGLFLATFNAADHDVIKTLHANRNAAGYNNFTVG